MDKNSASENLQVIRTLMERSALYRRALAPIMCYCGALGLLCGVIGWKGGVRTDRAFIIFWSSVAVVALIGAFLLVRRQALKDAEPFWSPPTRRVANALMPALFIGMLTNVLVGYSSRGGSVINQLLLVAFWMWFYGCAIHAAGFFMQRGIRLLGWIFIIFGTILVICFMNALRFEHIYPNLVMGFGFGGLHLAYGAYLYFTEKRKPV